MKRCSRCGKTKELSEFYTINTGPSAGYVNPKCKACVKDAQRDYNKSVAAILKSRYRGLRRSFGLSPEDFWSMWDAQDGRCPITGEDLVFAQPHGQRRGVVSPVDHNHETGEVRAILSCNANRAIGMLGDNPETLKVAAAYLERYGHYGETKRT